MRLGQSQLCQPYRGNWVSPTILEQLRGINCFYQSWNKFKPVLLGYHTDADILFESRIPFNVQRSWVNTDHFYCPKIDLQ